MTLSLPDVKHNQNPIVVVTKLLSNAGNAIMRHGDPHNGGLNVEYITYNTVILTAFMLSSARVVFCESHLFKR